MLKNHKNSNKNKTDDLSQYDVEHIYYYLMNDVRLQENQIKEMNGDTEGFKRQFKISKIPSKYQFSATRVAGGICIDCEKLRSTICNCCPIAENDLETAHCMRCICDEYEGPDEPLNNTGIPLEELVRRKQGWHRSKRKEQLPD
jgi:hypothetical protein